MVGENNAKDIIVRVGSTGDTETPIYIDDIRVTETVTDVRFGGIVLAEKNDGGIPYKSPESEKAFGLYDGETLVGEYDSWNKALSAYKSGYTLKLQSDYTLTDADLYSDFGMNGGPRLPRGQRISAPVTRTWLLCLRYILPPQSWWISSIRPRLPKKRLT